MMLTSTSLLLLLNPSYAMVIILVLPVIAIVVIDCYNGINNSSGQAREVTDYNYEDHRSELKQLFDLSASVTGGAFGGMLTTIFAYFKNFPKVVHQEVDVKFSEAFIFFTVIYGLLAMLLTTVPPSVAHPNARSRYITFIKVLSYSLFGLLALIGLAVAAQFLGQIIFLAFLPIFLAVVVWFRKEFISQEDGTSRDQGATGHESEPDASSITITAFIFAALMAVYSVNFGSEGDVDFHQKTCMFFMSMAFMSSLSWMAFRSPRTQSLVNAVTILTYSTLVWLVFAMLDLIFLAIRIGYTKRGNTN
ncbi:hypothetical protein COCNU_02G018480 [Cocos nucifera]|uniref:Uncharacterized protein n=1 Tax=Cocos nucifera TaxID=13894 RepID=A0A8K0MXG5_COCNU|nr:hypothetical protein COCNU_02G018480 [Cocos nucifera]